MRLHLLKEMVSEVQSYIKKIKVSDNQMVQSERSQVQYCSSS